MALKQFHRVFALKPGLQVAAAVGLAWAGTAPIMVARADDDAKKAEPNPAALAEVTVIANGSQVELTDPYAGGQVATGGRVGMFGNLDVMNTPFNSLNFTAKLIQDQQAQSVADVVQNDPTVRVARGYGNFQELYVIRGFPVYSDDVAYNGLYGLLPRQFVASQLLERVEVFRGANTFLNGAAPGGSGLGGAINLVPKRAPDEALNNVTMGFEGQSDFSLAGDVARRFGNNKQWGVRLNAETSDGETSVDNENRKLGVLAAGLDYRGDALRVSADVGYQSHHIDAPRPSVTPSGDIPKPPSADSNFAQDWTYSEERDLFGVIRGEYDITQDVMAWAAIGGRNSDEHNVLANPTSDADGNLTAYRFDNERDDTANTSEIGIRGKFQTGPVSHRLTASGTLYSLNSKNAYAFSDFTGFSSNLYDPVQVEAPSADYYVGGDLSDPLTTNRVKTRSAAVADMVGLFADRLMLTFGARYQVIEQYSYDYNTGIESSGYDKNKTTPIFGAVFKVSGELSVYGNYAQGLVQGDVAPSTSGSVAIANAGQVFSPYVTDQVEVGAKYDQGTFGATAAVFSTSKPTSIVTDDGYYKPDGEQKNKGLELSLYGEPVSGLRTLGGLTLLDATVEKSTDGLYDGKDAIGVPQVMVNAGLDWDIPGVQGLAVDGRVVYTGEQKASADNSIELDAWTRLDMGVRYSFDLSQAKLTLRGRVQNVTNENDWVSTGGASSYNYLVLGAPRTVMISASVDW